MMICAKLANHLATGPAYHHYVLILVEPEQLAILTLRLSGNIFIVLLFFLLISLDQVGWNHYKRFNLCAQLLLPRLGQQVKVRT